jgi:hypothetical protein
VSTLLHKLLNVLVQIANKMGLQKKMLMVVMVVVVMMINTLTAANS